MVRAQQVGNLIGEVDNAGKSATKRNLSGPGAAAAAAAERASALRAANHGSSEVRSLGVIDLVRVADTNYTTDHGPQTPESIYKSIRMKVDSGGAFKDPFLFSAIKAGVFDRLAQNPNESVDKIISVEHFSDGSMKVATKNIEYDEGVFSYLRVITFTQQEKANILRGLNDLEQVLLDPDLPGARVFIRSRTQTRPGGSTGIINSTIAVERNPDHVRAYIQLARDAFSGRVDPSEFVPRAARVLNRIWSPSLGSVNMGGERDVSIVELAD